jgi:phosphoribosylamine---glycine ligase
MKSLPPPTSTASRWSSPACVISGIEFLSRIEDGEWKIDASILYLPFSILDPCHMKILVIGSGGREHALVWKIRQSPRVTKVFAAPGSAAIGELAELVAIPPEKIDELAAFAEQEKIDLTVVGPEMPLTLGIADLFESRGLRIFGPNKAAAQLEGSKAFAKEILASNNIPTAAFGTFSDPASAKDFLRQQNPPHVIKADGLAAGKGVVICSAGQEAESVIDNILVRKVFGAAGSKVVVEEFLEGEEASFMVLTDGEHVLPLATSQDHKRRDDGDRGPNTGGMGAYSPAPVVTPALHQRIMMEVIEPTLRGLAADGTPYTGFLYAGLMIGPDGTPRVLEFNCRLGDPETQPLLARLTSDLTELCEAALAGTLDRPTARWDPRAALGVVMAAGGYPQAVRKGDRIDGLEAAERLPGKVFHAGTHLTSQGVVTNGGRVLCAVGLGDSVREAQAQAYALVDRIQFPGAQYRRDIGQRAVARERG